MAQIKNPLDEVRIPFAKMSFTPDVPSTALGPNEYNDGVNVETDVRGIRSMSGDQEFFDAIPGTPTFVTGGFRLDNEWWFVAATTQGYYWASAGNEWQDITPVGAITYDYDQATNITEAWNGTVLFLNDEHNPPFFWPDTPGAVLRMYSNQVPLDIIGLTPFSLTEKLVSFANQAPAPAPFTIGEYVTIANANPRYYNGTWLVTGSNTNSITIVCDITQAYSSAGTVAAEYTWNYNPTWTGYHAKFMRLYNTPNVGSILVAGNLTAALTDSSEQIYPVTVQWSQAFGLNQAPTTWTPTVTNVANQLEVPLRGPALDAFPCNGQFFLCSYWDTVVFSPINYSTTAAPILGVRQYNQGRGLLSSNCWANTDKLVYGVDARDIWVFDGQDFQGLGNQRVKNWFYDQLDPEFHDRVFMETNSQRSQIEIYYTTRPEYARASNPIVNGVPNMMISYRYDLQCWNAPRDVSSATFACEAPIFTNQTDSSLPEFRPDLSSRTVTYARGVLDQKLVQKDQGFEFISTAANPTGDIESRFRRDNIKLLPDYSGKLMVHRILPEVVNLNNNELPIDPAVDTALKGNITVTIEGANSVGSAPTAITPVTIPVDADGSYNLNPWAQINQNAFRVNSIVLNNTSNANIWMCSATTWQITQTEDDR